MRVFGLIGVLVALVLVGLLVRQQRGAQHPAASSTPTTGTPAAPTVREHGRQMQQQYQRALEQALQSASRDVPAEAR